MSPRLQPYDWINLIAGTKGIFRDYPPRIYVDGGRREESGPVGTAPDIDVYDGAARSARGPLSEASVARGSAPIDEEVKTG